ncbi:MAG: hypothetical protein JST67_05180 [Bacteroidetes bacterium]|nr:hypothetical protein [Bacteroidota bacterium]
MKSYLIAFILSALSLLAYSQGGTIIIEGNYQGKNLYVQNPFASGGVGFCVTEVYVNGNLTTDETQSSAFEIDFKPHKLVIGDKIEIKIKHKDGCKPKVLNPEVLKPKSTYEVISMSVSPDGTLKWSTKAESGKLAYVIEQYRWNKWVKVGEVDGVGTASTNNYEFKVTPHSGKNQFRVKQTDYSGQPRLSKSVEYNNAAGCDISFAPAKVSKEISFNCSEKPVETMYEIYDQYGNIVKRGYGSKVDCSNLAKGGYFLNYDNKMGEFVKK